MTLDDELNNTSRMRFQSTGSKQEDHYVRKLGKKKKNKDSDDEEEIGIQVLKDIMKNPKSDNHSSRSFDSSDQKQTKKEMIRFLSRILDRNKPLFVFNTRLNAEDEGDGAGTPRFSMLTLIHENE